MNLREAVEKAAETINQKQPCASEAHCLLTEALKCPDIILSEGTMHRSWVVGEPLSQLEDFGIEVVENAPVLL